MAERVAATERVVARFRGKPFDWRTSATCIHLARAQMRAMGYAVPTIPRFGSALTARRALAATGFPTLEALLDSLRPRIAPAAMLVGDLALVPGEPPFDAAIAISAGGALLMYHEDAEGLANVKDALGDVLAAWRL